MKNLYVIPVISEEMTDGCISSINHDYHEDILIVDNTVSGFASKYGVGHLSQPGRNIGVGRAWNLGVEKVLGSTEYNNLVILSATMRFHDGMDGLVKGIESHSNEYGLETQHGWHCIVLSRLTLERCGRFDENFYPAYYEDSDYIRRMELLGIHNPMSTTQRLPFIEIKAGFEGNAHGMKKGKIAVNMGACRQYFIDKWGYEPRYDSQRDRDLLYKHPFNDPTNEISFFPERSIEELSQLYDLKSFETKEDE